MKLNAKARSFLTHIEIVDASENEIYLEGGLRLSLSDEQASLLNHHAEDDFNLIFFKGKRYPYKEHNGLRFSVEALWDAIDDGDELTPSDEDMDDQICYYFTQEEFDQMTAKEMYDFYEENT